MYQNNSTYQAFNSFMPKKFLLPALFTASAGMYWQYYKMQTSKDNKRAIMRSIAKIPLHIKNLNEFSPLEINAITRRNTIKNKLVGRLRIAKQEKS